MKKTVAALILICIFKIYAQDSIPTSIVQDDYKPTRFFSYLVDDAKTLLTAPADFKTSDWLLTAGLAGGLGVLFWQDENISRTFKSHKGNNLSDNLAFIGNHSGEETVVAPLLASVWLTGYLTDNQRLQKTFFYSLETLALSAVCTQVIKYSAGRARPYLNLGSEEFIGLNKKADYNSFPSGHTQTAFAVASTFALEYQDNLWVTIPAYTLAATTAYARVRDNKHWPSDVFTGAMIGFFSAQAVRKAHAKMPEEIELKVESDQNLNPALALYYRF